MAPPALVLQLVHLEFMRILYTKHAKNKFKYAEELKWYIKEKDIEEAVQNPDFYSIEEKEVQIVLKEFDKNRNLRVVYSRMGDIITIITFYLTKKGRYEKLS